MPGGQFTNLKAQAKSLGLTDRWTQIAEAYADVNQMFGDIIKVTPTSKVVGDMALMMVSQGLNRAQVEDPNVEVKFPDSVVNMLKGNLGQPLGGFPNGIVEKVLKGETPNKSRPGSRIDHANLKVLRKELVSLLDVESISDEDFYSYLMYPKVFIDYLQNVKRFGPVNCLPTSVFFYGMKPADEISVEIDPGKILEVRLQAFGETNSDGETKVFFELNGQPRVIRIKDSNAKTKSLAKPKVDIKNSNHVGSPMPGVVASISVTKNQTVKSGELLLTIEAMKMETGIYSEKDGTVKQLYVEVGSQLDSKDLLVEIEN
jgi:pyruvate carboxylase